MQSKKRQKQPQSTRLAKDKKPVQRLLETSRKLSRIEAIRVKAEAVLMACIGVLDGLDNNRRETIREMRETLDRDNL